MIRSNAFTIAAMASSVKTVLYVMFGFSDGAVVVQYGHVKPMNAPWT